MRPVDFGWDYPPGVTGNEPEITGEENDDYDDTLGPCGCVDYHYADCPLRDYTQGSYYDEPYDEAWLEDTKYIRDEEYDRGEHE